MQPIGMPSCPVELQVKIIIIPLCYRYMHVIQTTPGINAQLEDHNKNIYTTQKPG